MRETFIEQVLGVDSSGSDADKWEKGVARTKELRPERNDRRTLLKLRQMLPALEQNFEREPCAATKSILLSVKQRVTNLEARLSGEIHAGHGPATPLATSARGSEKWKKFETIPETIPQDEERMNKFDRYRKRQKEGR
jgi:hypothetical protein